MPVLLEMLTDTTRSTASIVAGYGNPFRNVLSGPIFSRSYRAAVCLGTLAASFVGLKALYQHQAYAIVTHVLDMDALPSSTLNLICATIKTNLESKYQVESAV